MQAQSSPITHTIDAIYHQAGKLGEFCSYTHTSYIRVLLSHVQGQRQGRHCAPIICLSEKIVQLSHTEILIIATPQRELACVTLPKASVVKRIERGAGRVMTKYRVDVNQESNSN